MVIEAAGLPGPAQVGFVVGRRVGKAVVRNRVRRRLREAAALVDLGEGNAYIVIADRGAAESRLADLVVGMGQAVEADRRPSEGGA